MLEFETSKGNVYAWDDEVGIFIPFSDTMRAVITEMSNDISIEHIIKKLEKDFDQEDIVFCYNWLKKWKKIRPQGYKSQVYHEIQPENIRNSLMREGFSQLILCITEDCNFRCKFCAYSDSYEYTRNHSNKYMDFSTAKKAIDHFLSLAKEGIKYNPIREPTIGFYGGEPLLNFDLIKKCVEYARELYEHEINFTLTTNASVLDSGKSKWLIENGFSVLISLNGPEDEHDRLRVYKDGKGTFNDVMKNVSIMNGYNEAFKDMKNVSIMKDGYNIVFSLPVFDTKSDLFELENFFNRKDVPSVSKIGEVESSLGSNYYEQFTDKDHHEFSEQLKRAREYYFDNIDPKNHSENMSVFYNLFGLPIHHTLFNGNAITYPQAIPFTGSCIPGRKIFVDVNGNYHMCEKVPETNPIGDVNEGLNFETIGNLINDYFDHMDKCTECEIRRQCTCCFRDFMTDNGFLPSSEVCKEKESIMKESFGYRLEIAEKFPEFVDGYNIKHHNIRKYWG